jgi:hypothetical protein
VGGLLRVGCCAAALAAAGARGGAWPALRGVPLAAAGAEARRHRPLCAAAAAGAEEAGGEEGGGEEEGGKGGSKRPADSQRPGAGKRGRKQAL